VTDTPDKQIPAIVGDLLDRLEPTDYVLTFTFRGARPTQAAEPCECCGTPAVHLDLRESSGDLLGVTPCPPALEHRLVGWFEQHVRTDPTPVLVWRTHNVEACQAARVGHLEPVEWDDQEDTADV
jgi:hypothetical protein